MGAYARYANLVKENYHLAFNIKSGPLSFLALPVCRLLPWTDALIAISAIGLFIAVVGTIVAIIYWLHLAYKIGESVAPI